MATLVFSTVGEALGGPIGGAIGALIGQSIDQELFAPSRRGPRLGDLAVQSSTYGTDVPRIYGTMRVAGSVIWATDLVEHSATGGVKGQPDVSYSYTVSFAVAVASREANAIGRIWADGKLLRGAAGDMKVGGQLRFYTGTEDQAIDPLIASVEGIANTPAYRGLAIAVFEDLELADFGNRIPFLTFEVIADSAPPSVGAIVSDASFDAIAASTTATLTGYAAYGRSIRDAVQPLVDTFAVPLFDDGNILRSAGEASAASIDEEEFGNSVDQQQAARLQREQAPARSLAATLRLNYYEPARDFQAGEARASAGEQSGSEVRQELAAALDASSAKALAQTVIARNWAQRNRLTLRLPPKRLSLEPGTKVSLPLSPSQWVVQDVTIEGFVVAATLYPTSSGGPSLASDPGRVAINPDITAAPMSLALLDVPDVLGINSAGPKLLLAASCASPGWKSQSVEIEFGGQQIATQTARRKSVLGRSATVLATAQTDLLDLQSWVEIDLQDSTQWLTSCDNDALAAGENLAALGAELIQFARVTPLGDGRFRLEQLLRGRGGTEWACGTHAIGEPFCLIDGASLQPVALPAWSIGATVEAIAPSGARASTLFTGEAVRPVSPVNLTARLQDSGDLLLGWTRRSRLGFAWVDGIDAPLGESNEQYRLVITSSAASLELAANQPSLIIAAAQVARLGGGLTTIQVQQIGDFAASRPAQTSTILP